MSVPYEDGGQAFPAAYTVGPNDDLYPPAPGMTLHDFFVAKAMAGFFSNPAVFASNPQSGWGLVNCDEATLLVQCHRLADAAIAARSK